MNNWKEKIPAIFAEQGDVVEVPLDAQTDSQVSFETGYTANYERDAVDDLGNPLVQYGIERTKFNYLMKVITSALKDIQETIPTYEDNGVDKVDVSSIVTDTNAFDVLESILCINADTGKASKITKDDIIKNLNPDVDLSNSNISVSQLATTAVDNFLALDGDVVKKADKLLQEAIAEINLSADNVVVSASATVDVVDSVIVMNTDGKVAKATTISQEKIEEINLSKDNIAIDEYTDQEQGSIFKPVISSHTGSVYRKDKLEGSMIESIKFEQIEDDVYARSINCTIMTSDTYPDGIDNLIQTGVYHVITPDEYKDIINDQIDTADKEEYILKVMNSFLTNLNMIKEPFTDIASLVAYAGSDFISPYEPIIQVLGVSANGTDDTNVTQVFKLNGEVKGQRTFTATTGGLTNEVWIPVSTYIRDTIEEELIAFMYDGVPDEATSDVNTLRTFKTIGYNNKEELSYGFSFGGFNCYDVITIDTDLDWTDKSDTVDSDVYVAAYTYNQSLLTIDDTKIIKLNGKVIENESDITNVKDVIFFVKDRTHNIKYIALGRNTDNFVQGYLFDAGNDEFLDTTKVKDFFRPNYHLIYDTMSCTDYYNFTNTEIKLRNIVIGADVKMFSKSFGVNTDTVIAKNLIIKDNSFNPVMTVTSASTTLNNELVVNNGLIKGTVEAKNSSYILSELLEFIPEIATHDKLRILFMPFRSFGNTTADQPANYFHTGIKLGNTIYENIIKISTNINNLITSPTSSNKNFVITNKAKYLFGENYNDIYNIAGSSVFNDNFVVTACKLNGEIVELNNLSILDDVVKNRPVIILVEDVFGSYIMFLNKYRGLTIAVKHDDDGLDTIAEVFEKYLLYEDNMFNTILPEVTYYDSPASAYVTARPLMFPKYDKVKDIVDDPSIAEIKDFRASGNIKLIPSTNSISKLLQDLTDTTLFPYKFAEENLTSIITSTGDTIQVFKAGDIIADSILYIESSVDSHAKQEILGDTGTLQKIKGISFEDPFNDNNITMKRSYSLKPISDLITNGFINSNTVVIIKYFVENNAEYFICVLGSNLKRGYRLIIKDSCISFIPDYNLTKNKPFSNYLYDCAYLTLANNTPYLKFIDSSSISAWVYNRYHGSSYFSQSVNNGNVTGTLDIFDLIWVNNTLYVGALDNPKLKVTDTTMEVKGDLVVTGQVISQSQTGGSKVDTAKQLELTNFDLGTAVLQLKSDFVKPDESMGTIDQGFDPDRRVAWQLGLEDSRDDFKIPVSVTEYNLFKDISHTMIAFDANSNMSNGSSLAFIGAARPAIPPVHDLLHAYLTLYASTKEKKTKAWLRADTIELQGQVVNQSGSAMLANAAESIDEGTVIYESPEQLPTGLTIRDIQDLSQDTYFTAPHAVTTNKVPIVTAVQQAVGRANVVCVHIVFKTPSANGVLMELLSIQTTEGITAQQDSIGNCKGGLWFRVIPHVYASSNDLNVAYCPFQKLF